MSINITLKFSDKTVKEINIPTSYTYEKLIQKISEDNSLENCKAVGSWISPCVIKKTTEFKNFLTIKTNVKYMLTIIGTKKSIVENHKNAEKEAIKKTIDPCYDEEDIKHHESAISIALQKFKEKKLPYVLGKINVLEGKFQFNNQYDSRIDFENLSKKLEQNTVIEILVEENVKENNQNPNNKTEDSKPQNEGSKTEDSKEKTNNQDLNNKTEDSKNQQTTPTKKKVKISELSPHVKSKYLTDMKIQKSVTKILQSIYKLKENISLGNLDYVRNAYAMDNSERDYPVGDDVCTAAVYSKNEYMIDYIISLLEHFKIGRTIIFCCEFGYLRELDKLLNHEIVFIGETAKKINRGYSITPTQQEGTRKKQIIAAETFCNCIWRAFTNGNIKIIRYFKQNYSSQFEELIKLEHEKNIRYYAENGIKNGHFQVVKFIILENIKIETKNVIFQVITDFDLIKLLMKWDQTTYEEELAIINLTRKDHENIYEKCLKKGAHECFLYARYHFSIKPKFEDLITCFRSIAVIYGDMIRMNESVINKLGNIMGDIFGVCPEFLNCINITENVVYDSYEKPKKNCNSVISDIEPTTNIIDENSKNDSQIIEKEPELQQETQKPIVLFVMNENFKEALLLALEICSETRNTIKEITNYINMFMSGENLREIINIIHEYDSGVILTRGVSVFDVAIDQITQEMLKKLKEEKEEKAKIEKQKFYNIEMDHQIRSALYIESTASDKNDLKTNILGLTKNADESIIIYYLINQYLNIPDELYAYKEHHRDKPVNNLLSEKSVRDVDGGISHELLYNQVHPDDEYHE